jgi:hypothetical protein
MQSRANFYLFKKNTQTNKVKSITKGEERIVIGLRQEAAIHILFFFNNVLALYYVCIYASVLCIFKKRILSYFFEPLRI